MYSRWIFLLPSLVLAVSPLLSSLATAAHPPYVQQLPRDTLVAARIAQLDQLDAMVQPLAESFGLEIPAIGTVASTLAGVDARGDVVLGITRVKNGTYVPFVLLPIVDYKEFAHAGDGDAGLDYTPLTLVDEELLASHRGRWALVTNPMDDFDQLGNIAQEDIDQITLASNESLLELTITPRGLDELSSIASARTESAHRLTSRRRSLASRSMDWKSLSDWQERLVLYYPMIDRFSKHSRSMQLLVDVNRDLSIQLAIYVSSREELPIKVVPLSLPEPNLDNERFVARVTGPWGSPWQKLMLEMYVDSFAAGSDSVGITYIMPNEFKALRESMGKLNGEILGVQALMIAPQEGQPTMSNSALVLEVADSSKVMATIDAYVADWNDLIEKSRRTIDFIFEVHPLTVAKLKGKRYSIDLPNAFRQSDQPEIRKLMDDMYGRNGVWAVDALPIDEQHILISDLPDAVRDQMLDQLKSGNDVASQAPSNVIVTLEPATMQDWLNRLKRHTYGDDVVGWKPKSLECESSVVIEATTHASVLELHATMPSDVVQALGKLARTKKQ